VQGKLDEAIAAYRAALTSPAFDVPASAHLGIGDALVAAGRIEEAIAEYRKAVESAPDRAEFHLGLARAYAYAKWWDEAKASLLAAMKATPDSPEVHYTQAVVSLFSGEAAQAAEPLRKAISLPDPPARARAAVAYYLATQGSAEAAGRQLADIAEPLAAAQNDADIDLLYWAVMTQRKLGDQQAADKLLATLAGRWPKHPLTVALAAG